MFTDVTDYRLRTIRSELYNLYKDLGEMIDRNEPSYQDNFASQNKWDVIFSETRFLRPDQFYSFRFLTMEAYPVRISGSDNYLIRTVNIPVLSIVPYDCFQGYKEHGRYVDYYVGSKFSDVIDVFAYICSTMLPLPVLNPVPDQEELF